MSALGCLVELFKADRMISFIVPAYNEEALIGRTLEALNKAANQIGEPYEIVVANDALNHHLLGEILVVVQSSVNPIAKKSSQAKQTGATDAEQRSAVNGNGARRAISRHIWHRSPSSP